MVRLSGGFIPDLLRKHSDLPCFQEVGVNMRDTVLFLLVVVLSFQMSVMGAFGQSATNAQGQALTFRVAGSSLSDVSGANVGNVESISVDPQSGQVTFVMVSLGFPTDRTRVTPIPWQLIQHRRDARAAGGIPGTFQQFIVPFSQQVLRNAPQIDSQAMARATDAGWMTTSYNYFAPLAAAGGINTALGTQTGAGNSIANPNVSGFAPPATNGIIPTNSLALTNAATNTSLPGAFPPRAANPILPAGAVPPGTLPADALPPGTVPAPALPPGTLPNEGGPFAPANPPPPRIPLTPVPPAAPAK